jgi:hypothetical protein
VGDGERRQLYAQGCSAVQLPQIIVHDLAVCMFIAADSMVGRGSSHSGLLQPRALLRHTRTQHCNMYVTQQVCVACGALQHELCCIGMAGKGVFCERYWRG